MAEPNVMDLKDIVLTLVDGASPTPNELEIYFDEGNLTFTTKQNVEYKKNRGRLAGGSVRLGDEEALEVSFSGRFSKIKSDTGEDVSPYEFLTKTGAAAAFVTVGEECAPYAINLVATRTNNCGDVKDEVITFPEFRFTSIGGDFKEGTLSVAGTCNVVHPESERPA